MTEKYLLLYRKIDDDEWKRFLFSEVVTVGESRENLLAIKDGLLSHKHLEIRENPTGIYIKDVDAGAGETFVGDQPILANRPTPVELNQIFLAGQYQFQVTLNAEEVFVEPSMIQQITTTIKGFGIWKTIMILLAVIAITAVGALLIYHQVVKRPGDIVATAVNNEVIEVVGTLVPTELFELSSTVVVDVVDAIVTAPGMGNFELQQFLVDISDMNVSNLLELSMNPGQLMEMSTAIVGENVGYIYAYSGLEKDGMVITTGLELIDAEQTETVDGVQMPSWGEGEIPIDMAWEPVLHYLEDGSLRSIVLLQPTIYGVDPSEQVYRVDGIYQQAGSETKFSSIARFAGDGNLIDILTFGEVGNERQTPYKVNFNEGDHFTPYEMEFIHDPDTTEEMALELTGGSLPIGWAQLLQLAIGGSNNESFQFGIGAYEKHPGTTLSMGENDIYWTTDDSPDGNFVAGIAVEDLDGNLFVGYIPVIIQP
jgi:hypothetical protein